MISRNLSSRTKVQNKTNGRCYYCGVDFSSLPNSERFTIDHLIPAANGGGNEIENLVPSCHDCNVLKKSDDINTFRRTYCRLRILKYPTFTQTHKDWLLNRGIDIDREINEFSSQFKFFFERVGAL